MSTGNHDSDRGVLVDRYLDALNLGRRQPSLAFLSDITRGHVGAFAFASVGPRLGNELPLALDALFDRIVVRGRGGYCFEQNGLLFEVLDELGFAPRVQLARVIYNRTTLPGLTHRVTIVDLDGHPYVADVGFGPLGPPHPVALPGLDQVDDGFRIAEPQPGEHHMQTRVDGEWFSLYRFQLGPYGQADCELGHFYSHRHPDATFVNHLVASRILDGEVRSLRNRGYRVMRADGDTEIDIVDAAQLKSVLEQEFGLLVTNDEATRLFDEAPAAEAT